MHAHFIDVAPPPLRPIHHATVFIVSVRCIVCSAVPVGSSVASSTRRSAAALCSGCHPRTEPQVAQDTTNKDPPNTSQPLARPIAALRGECMLQADRLLGCKGTGTDHHQPASAMAPQALMSASGAKTHHTYRYVPLFSSTLGGGSADHL
jgi:hypothetical protein